MATIRILFGIVCLAVMGSSRMPERNLLAGPLHKLELSNAVKAKKLIEVASAEIGVRERTGRNDGQRVEAYLSVTGMTKGQPYCAAFVSWVFKAAGYDRPRTAWSPALFTSRVLVKTAAPGNVFGIRFPALNRIAHCGLVAKVKGDWISTIEANTNLPGSRDGDGVYARTRHIRTIQCYGDWLRKGNRR